MQARTEDPISALTKRGFDVQYLSHAKSILTGEFLPQLEELAGVLAKLSLPITEIIGSGGGETRFTQRTRNALSQLGWRKHNFVIAKVIDGVQKEATSHEVDHVRTSALVGTIGCEIEWNNKDPFFDRDLENFKRLHAEGAISVGVIITRGSSLQAGLWDLVRRFATERRITDFGALASLGVTPTPKQVRNIKQRVERMKGPVAFADAWTDNFVSSKFGAATTHWEKLQARVARGVGNPCPMLHIGLPASIVVFDDAQVEQLDEESEGPTAGRQRTGRQCSGANGADTLASRERSPHRPGFPTRPNQAARRARRARETGQGCTTRSGRTVRRACGCARASSCRCS